MKCPKCEINHKYKDGMRCRCGYAFALDPKHDKFTDGKLLGCVRAASANDTYFFTPNQLYTAYCRKQQNSPTSCFVLAAVLLFVAMVFAFLGPLSGLAVGFLIAAGFMVILGVITFFKRPMRQNDFQDIIRLYEKASKSKLPKMIRKPALHKPPPKWPEPDIYDYGVECLVIVQHDVLVDLLVKNNVHSTNRALVLSGKMYPDYLEPLAIKALQENPELPVFFLHDATPEGEKWFETLSNSQRLPWDDHPRIDLGLHADDVRRIKKLRPLHPENNDYHLAADYLPMAMLGVGLASALEQNSSLGELLAMEYERHADGFASFG